MPTARPRAREGDRCGTGLLRTEQPQRAGSSSPEPGCRLLSSLQGGVQRDGSVHASHRAGRCGTQPYVLAILLRSSSSLKRMSVCTWAASRKYDLLTKEIYSIHHSNFFMYNKTEQSCRAPARQTSPALRHSASLLPRLSPHSSCLPPSAFWSSLLLLLFTM